MALHYGFTINEKVAAFFWQHFQEIRFGKRLTLTQSGFDGFLTTDT